MSRTYLDGLRRAHEVALGSLPLPCGGTKKRRAALKDISILIGIPIRAIEAEIAKEEGK